MRWAGLALIVLMVIGVALEAIEEWEEEKKK